MKRVLVHTLNVLAVVTAFASAGSSQTNVLTANYGNDRSNANLQETTLTPANVATGRFGKLGSLPVDGQVFAQPLYVSGLAINGKGTHNVVYLMTQHNSVFAYDADSVATPDLLWHVNFGASVPNTLFPDFFDIDPEIGILSTGAIDLQANALYVVSETLQGTQPVFQLHALDLRTGAEILNGPATVAAQVPGTGDGSVNGIITFDPMWHIQRPGLLLANGSVYFTFGSHGDLGPWHGWLFRYSASDLRETPGVLVTTKTGSGGSIWQSGRGLAADETGAIYAITGNGDYDGINNFGESFLKVSNAPVPAISDWYTPPNWQALVDDDADLSAGVGLIPGTHLLIGGDKDNNMYLVNGDNMGHGVTGNVQTFQAVQTGGIFNFAVWPKGNQTFVFVPGLFSSFKAFAVTGGVFGTAPVSLSAGTIDNPYLGLTLSANGSQDGSGILWATTGNHDDDSLPGTLHAFDASNLSNELWNSDMTGGPDAVGTFAKFANPTVVNGKVYVPTWSNWVTVYGPLGGSSQNQTPAIAAVSNSASYLQSAVAPGELVTLFGQNMGRSQTDALQVDMSGNVSTLLGNTLVYFDGVPSPMVYAAPGQVSAIVPFGVSSSTTQVQVEYAGQMSNSLQVPVASSAPGIFTFDGSGKGQAAALNPDYSVNTPDHPVAAGSMLVLYATGGGQFNTAVRDGSVMTPQSLPQPRQNVSVQVGGQDAVVLYAGAAPFLVAGVLQINIQLPPGVTGASLPLVVTIGDAASQPGVTVAVQ